MTLPFTLPDWLPWWVPLLLLVPALLYAMLLLAMPFNVFGVKGRLERSRPGSTRSRAKSAA